MLSLIKKGLFYTFSIGTESLIALALLKILTSALNPNQYGIWVILFSFTVFLRPILNLMFQDILKMKFFNSSNHEILGLIKLSIYIPIILGTLLSITSCFFAQQLDPLLHFSSKHIWEISVFAALHGFYYVLLGLIQFKEKPRLFLLQQLGQTIITILGTVILLNFNLTWIAPLYARTFALFINCSFGFRWICQNFGNPLHTSLSKKQIKEYLMLGLQFLPVGFAPGLIPFVNRLIVSNIAGVEETSYFGIGSLFSSAIIIVATGFIYAWQPILYKNLNDKTSSSSIKYYSLCYFILLPCAAFSLAIVSKFIAPYIMNYKLEFVMPYIVWLSVATVAECFYMHNYIYIKGLQKTHLLSIFACILIILNSILVYYFVTNLGGLGAAWGSASAYLILSIISGCFIIATARKKA